MTTIADFTTDAQLRTAIARDFPNVRMRIDNEWNEYHLQRVAHRNDNADWRNGLIHHIDRQHDRADRIAARLETWETARDLQNKYCNA